MKMALLFSGRRILQARKLLISNPRNTGYVVLLPEIGDISADPLSQNDGLPEFSNVTIENCTASIAKQTLEFESGVKKIEKDLESKDVDIVKYMLEPLEILCTPLELTWGISKTLYLGNNTLIPTKTYLPIHERARRARSTKYHNDKIYKAVKNELSKEKEWDSEVKRVLDKFLLEGKLNGLELEGKNAEKLKETWNKLTSEKQQFKRKIDVQNQKFSHTISDYNIVREFPKDLLEKISADTRNILNGPWKITLQPHIYLPTMQYCPDREIRWNLWQALVKRGSGYSDKESATSIHIEEIRSQRHLMAELLGYKSFVDMSMQTKMAGSIENVKNSINTLLEKAKPAQDAEIKSLHDFATQNGFNYEQLELWDVPYWRRKQEMSVYNFNADEYKEYLPYPSVLRGLFKLSEKLFNIVIKQRKDVSTWHKDVEFYDILEPHCSAP
ncbi:hypothetical protein HHI36_019334 [Cryptolaemus montrouzieri]|uniref:Peptidase M3A/M3B catalytic domain-containing protein n=1 Tax=Cryptolaemus montrouzieri TaxID=559131 RepID=A0ABD2P2Q4_9CUCU